MPDASEHVRPDPDKLLKHLGSESAKGGRGRLKIFFGASPGVGKTFAMISDARRRAMEGLDVVVGYAEPHARPETEELLIGLELLSFRVVDYKGATLREFDLEAALQRRPELLLIDELAHTNAPGLRHAKRWQDVEELLQAGVNVYTTLNVQHLESLNDVVAQVTGVVVRETLPDAVFDNADEVELVDLPPDELLERMREGKVYIPERAEQAVTGFFRKHNLVALRELALRKVADRVGSEVLGARDLQAPRRKWATRERIVVCVGPSPTAATVIRSAKRMAVSLHAEWIAAFVERPRLRGLSRLERARLHRNFRLAERLGAETVTLSGHDAAEELVSYARQRNATRIVAGKPNLPWWRDWLNRSLVDRLLRLSGEIDVYVVRGLPEEDARADAERPTDDPPASRRPAWRAFAAATLVIALCTAASAGFVAAWPRFHLVNQVMVYLLGVVFVAARHGRRVSMYASLLSVACFDFFFVPPRFTFAVHDTQFVVTFGVMLGVAVLISTLTSRVREQAESSRARERGTEALYRMIEDIASAGGAGALADTAMRHAHEIFHAQAAVLLPDESGRVAVRAASDPRIGRAANDLGVAQWVFDHRQPAGRGTDTLPAADALYVPLAASRGAVGVLALRHDDSAHLLTPDQRSLLDAVADQVALAIERDQLTQAARRSQLHAETENLRSSLLSSVSHDLRTPLSVITGASSALLEGRQGAEAQRELVQTIRDESERLTRLVGNLLDITRLESLSVDIRKEWHPIEEVIGSALRHLDRQLRGRRVTTDLPPMLPLVQMDGVLIEQVLVNLVENAAKYAPDGGAIRVAAAAGDGRLLVEVSDDGPGLAPGESSRVFEKFYRGDGVRGQRGAGLGLSICRAIVEAHGGRIWADTKAAPDHGAVFRFTLPAESPAPHGAMSAAPEGGAA